MTPDLYDDRLPCIGCSSSAKAIVADSSKENGHSGELGAQDPALVSHRKGENDEENRQDKIEVWF